MSPTEATTRSVRPADLRELRDAVLDTAGPLAVVGAGTAADWGGVLDPVDTVLDTTALRGVITHNPGDMTASVHAGTPLRALNDELASHGQHVAFDAARVADGATVGGLVATADAGPSALVHGSLRDLVIGVTVVLADGTVARSGGHVIKNVAGYDLAKLLHGSYGTLAVLAEVVLRLHPVAKRTMTAAVECNLADASEHAARVLAGPYEPTALEWIGDDTTAAGQLLVRVEGTEAALDARATRLVHALGAGARAEPHERHSHPPGVDERAVRSGDPWEQHAALVRGGGAGAVLRIGVRPATLAGVLGSLPGLVGVTAGLGSGVATVRLSADGVTDVHAIVHAAGGTSALRTRPAGTDLAAWGPPPSALAVLRAVKNQLDPGGRFGPGRFSPWM